MQKGVAGIPTAFVATWGSGKPVIALGSDIDGIPQASQKPGVAYHAPMIEGAPGHGEGHNSGQAVNITAALAVKKIMEREKLPGTMRIWTGTAEELVGTKAYFIQRGTVQGRRRRALHTRRRRPGRLVGRSRRAPGWCRCSTRFVGETAHAAGAPWRGRSALDAVELMDIGWNFRREHLPSQPALALRHHRRRRSAERRAAHRVGLVLLPRDDYPHIKELWETGDTIAKGGGA